MIEPDRILDALARLLERLTGLERRVDEIEASSLRRLQRVIEMDGRVTAIENLLHAKLGRGGLL